MSDFLQADISDLMNVDIDPEDEDDKAYQELVARDHSMLSSFTETPKSRLNWPEPVRKKHIR